jgi:uncharacterized membrane-anchored protein
MTLVGCLVSLSSRSQEMDSTQLQIEAIEKSLKYETGTIALGAGNAKLTVPEGFRFLDKKQSMYVLSDLWGNPADSAVLGMLVPQDKGVLGASSWVFAISFDEIGYVEDDDAEDIDYDELLVEQQKETREANPERIAQGYGAIDFIGWASAPYYDKDKKILHWAKELQFGDDSTVRTLNYNLRVLGRKGIFVLNAVASMNELPEVKSNIDKVIGSVTFDDGFKYSDFSPDVDNVAAWTIGGLVAGKVLAKAGFFAILLKFWKIIAIGIASVGSIAWKFIRGKKDEEQA